MADTTSPAITIDIVRFRETCRELQHEEEYLAISSKELEIYRRDSSHKMERITAGNTCSVIDVESENTMYVHNGIPFSSPTKQRNDKRGKAFAHVIDGNRSSILCVTHLELA